MPFDGVFELNYLFQHRFDIARSGGPDLCAAFLDFTNAYGSVPRRALLDALRGSGAGELFTSLIKDLYRDNSTVIVADEGSTTPIPILAGLRQGCPLSGLFFNLVIDPVIRNVQGAEKSHNILAYADDLTPLATSPDMLQSLIDRIETLASTLGLALNPAKCSSLHMCDTTPVGMRPTRFLVSGTPITALEDYQPQRFLGRTVGFQLSTTSTTFIDEAISQAQRIFSSLLTPWQRIDTVRTFVFPALHFAMRFGTLMKTDWKRLDNAVRPLVKRTFYLPTNASTNYIYGSSAGGAASIPETAVLSDICRIDSAFKLLTTPDTQLREIARADAYSVASARLGWEVTRFELEAYLRGSVDLTFGHPASQLRSVWTLARAAARRLNITWSLDVDNPAITCGDVTLPASHRCRVMRSYRSLHLLIWLISKVSPCVPCVSTFSLRWATIIIYVAKFKLAVIKFAKEAGTVQHPSTSA